MYFPINATGRNLPQKTETLKQDKALKLKSI